MMNLVWNIEIYSLLKQQQQNRSLKMFGFMGLIIMMYYSASLKFVIFIDLKRIQLINSFGKRWVLFILLHLGFRRLCMPERLLRSSPHSFQNLLIHRQLINISLVGWHVQYIMRRKLTKTGYNFSACLDTWRQNDFRLIRFSCVWHWLVLDFVCARFRSFLLIRFLLNRIASAKYTRI